jgi:hypothetical protein
MVKGESTDTIKDPKKGISIVIVDKTGTLKSQLVKEYDEQELYKKAGFKKADGFKKQNEWGVKLDGIKYSVAVYAKTEGKAGTENKYDFPPPVDTVLFFGSCVLVGSKKMDNGTWETVSLSLENWEKAYEKLFGGFEDLAVTAVEDEEEEDELANVPKDKKTKHGYLKDGFVVDSNSDEDDECESYDEDSSDEFDDSEEADEQESGEIVIDDIGSELSEEEYVTDDDESDEGTTK